MGSRCLGRSATGTDRTDTFQTTKAGKRFAPANGEKSCWTGPSGCLTPLVPFSTLNQYPPQRGTGSSTSAGDPSRLSSPTACGRTLTMTRASLLLLLLAPGAGADEAFFREQVAPVL